MPAPPMCVGWSNCSLSRRFYAPFDGVITARNTDIGDLIDAEAGTQPRQLFHMASIRGLRVYVPVPEVYAPAAHPGATTL